MLKKLLCYLLVLSTSMIEAQVIINEFDSDNPSTDDKEFIELKSATPNFWQWMSWVPHIVTGKQIGRAHV